MFIGGWKFHPWDNQFSKWEHTHLKSCYMEPANLIWHEVHEVEQNLLWKWFLLALTPLEVPDWTGCKCQWGRCCTPVSWSKETSWSNSSSTCSDANETSESENWPWLPFWCSKHLLKTSFITCYMWLTISSWEAFLSWIFRWFSKHGEKLISCVI